MNPRFLNRFSDLWRVLSGEAGDLFVRRPRYLIGRQRLEIRHLFRGVERTPAVTIYTGVLWIIPLVMVNAYAAPYMVECGLSRAEVGYFTAWSQALYLLGFLSGGHLADTWGRKKTLVLFDTTSWGLYTLFLAVGLNKWWCVAAIFAMATNAGANISYQCLLVEGVKPYKRSRIFTLLQFVNLLPSVIFLPLLGGVLVSRFGLVPAGHAMYAFFFLCIGTGIFLRWKYIPDAPPASRAPVGGWSTLKDMGASGYAAFRTFLGKPGARPFFAARLVEEFKLFAWTTYSSLFLIDAVGITKGHIAVLVQASAYVTFLVVIGIIPYVPVRRFLGFLGYEQLFAVSALGIFLLARGSDERLLLSLVGMGLMAVTTAFYWSANNAYWLTIMGDTQRAKVVSFATAVIRASIFVLGPLAAVLYVKVSPESLVAVLMVLLCVEFLLLRRVVRVTPHVAAGNA